MSSSYPRTALGVEEVGGPPSKTRPARYPRAYSALPGVLPGLTGLPPRGRSEAEAAEGGSSRSSSNRSSRSRSRSWSWSLRPQEAMAGSGRRQHTGPHPAPAVRLDHRYRAGSGKGTGSAMRPTARRSRAGAPPWKKCVAGGYRKLDAGASDKARIVPGREGCAEGTPGREAGEGRGLRPAIAS